ncbi:MAG: hypothetical protein JWM20_42 [Patescibacteria group bacterium]|nr:hypothetical protein [Patescibacteria group bacterium]
MLLNIISIPRNVLEWNPKLFAIIASLVIMMAMTYWKRFDDPSLKWKSLAKILGCLAVAGIVYYFHNGSGFILLIGIISGTPWNIAWHCMSEPERTMT